MESAVLGVKECLQTGPHICCAAPTCADDVALIVRSREDLQTKLDLGEGGGTFCQMAPYSGAFLEGAWGFYLIKYASEKRRKGTYSTPTRRAHRHTHLLHTFDFYCFETLKKFIF